MEFLRKLLFPFSLLYAGVTWVRNFMFEKGYLKSKSYEIPIICVGNLSTGGTGKTPMVEYLISILKDKMKVAVLSRGYGRKTKGFKEVAVKSEAWEVGDEPLQFKNKFPQVSVAVCEDRQTGIEKIQNSAEVILLDDAFQHRKVKASFNILLTAFDHLYIDDFILPTGNLREPKAGADRAEIIVVTKCPEQLSDVEMDNISNKLSVKPNQEIYFSKIGYSNEIYNVEENFPLNFLAGKKFLLVTGIANPDSLVAFLKGRNFLFSHLAYADHHNFTPSEISEINKNELILTTEKDFMRLKTHIKSQLFYLPIEMVFLKNAESFRKRVEKAINYC